MTAIDVNTGQTTPSAVFIRANNAAAVYNQTGKVISLYGQEQQDASNAIGKKFIGDITGNAGAIDGPAAIYNNDAQAGQAALGIQNLPNAAAAWGGAVPSLFGLTAYGTGFYDNSYFDGLTPVQQALSVGYHASAALLTADYLVALKAGASQATLDALSRGEISANNFLAVATTGGVALATIQAYKAYLAAAQSIARLTGHAETPIDRANALALAATIEDGPSPPRPSAILSGIGSDPATGDYLYDHGQFYFGKTEVDVDLDAAGNAVATQDGVTVNLGRIALTDIGQSYMGNTPALTVGGDGGTPVTLLLGTPSAAPTKPGVYLQTTAPGSLTVTNVANHHRRSRIDPRRRHRDRRRRQARRGRDRDGRRGAFDGCAGRDRRPVGRARFRSSPPPRSAPSSAPPSATC